MIIHKPITKQSFNFDSPVNILCETYRVREVKNEQSGKIESVYLEGVAITFGKPTRNRVSYTYQSGIGTHKTLVGKPFLDTHNDSSIRTHPPFGHVEMTEPGTNPKNQLPCLFYRVNIDPEETVFIRKAKRGDIPGVSIQVLVDDVMERDDAYGSYIEASIREYLELSAVLIPGDGDTSMSLAESFQKMKEKAYKEVDTTNGEGIIGPDGVFPKRKILGEAEGDTSVDDNVEMPLQPLPKPEKNYGSEEPELDVDKPDRMVGSRNTEVAFKGCDCPACGMQMLKDNYNNGFQLRCWACNYRIDNIGGKEKMTVKAVRKEMDMSNQVPQQQPVPQQPMDIPDHTHPEYDQMMVKLQEIEGQLQGQAPGGINQESLDEGKPKYDAGKPTGNQQPISDNQGNDDPKKIESYIRKIIREELTGVPERDKGKALDSSGPENTSNIPQTDQPANGEAPSGGNFDSDDKTNKEDGDETINLVPKPKGEFPKDSIKKNKMNQAKSLIERAKKLMTEANGEDPSEPNPGATEQDPKKMDGSVPNKSPMGGTEELDGDASEDPEANVPNDKRPLLKENTVDKIFANLKKEMIADSKNKRESFVGLTAHTNENTLAAQEDFLETKTAVTNTMK